MKTASNGCSQPPTMSKDAVTKKTQENQISSTFSMNKIDIVEPPTKPSDAHSFLHTAFNYDQEQNYQKAIEYYIKSAELGHALSQYKLGLFYLKGLGTENNKKNYQKALMWFLIASENGSVSANFQIGLLYKEGHTMVKSYKKAAEWLAKASEEGHPLAQFNLSILYEQGVGVPRDIEKAESLLKKSQGKLSTTNDLATKYRDGIDCERNYAKAFEMFLEAAEYEDDEAYVNLGNMYRNGQGTPQNYKIAFDYYMKAAEKANSKAYNNLSLMYSHGLGVKVNMIKAAEWCLEAIYSENFNAKTNLNNIYKHCDVLPPQIVVEMYEILVQDLVSDWMKFSKLEAEIQKKTVRDILTPVIKKFVGDMYATKISGRILNPKSVELDDLKALLENPAYLKKKLHWIIDSYCEEELIIDREMEEAWNYFIFEYREKRKSDSDKSKKNQNQKLNPNYQKKTQLQEQRNWDLK